MQRLFILRHAKSDWHSDSHSDFERPLNKRGQADATRIGQWLAQQEALPALVLCSSAHRARQTWEQVCAQLADVTPESRYLDALYLADLGTLYRLLEKVLTETSSLMLIGHNPGLEELLVHLCPQQPRLSASGKVFTTANLAILALPEKNPLQAHGARLETLLRPDEI